MKYDDCESQDEDTKKESLRASAVLQRKNTVGETVNIKANQRFKNYQDVFKDLLKTSNVSTDNPIVSMIISQDSSRALSVTKQDDSTHFIK